MYPVFRKSLITKADVGNCFKSIIKPSVVSSSTFSATKDTRLINVQKLRASNIDEKLKTEKKCGDKATMTNRLDDGCLADEGGQCSLINCLPASNVLNKNINICLTQEENENGRIESLSIDRSMESIYNKSTTYLIEDIKYKLSCLRCTEYSCYGKELVKTNKLSSIKNELFTVATYNVLSQNLLEKHRYLYSSHDNRSLGWNVRREILLEELALLDADILCLQEVDFDLVEPFYNSFLHERGYKGVYKRRMHGKEDGCAIYFKTRKFTLIEWRKIEFYMESIRLLDRDNIGIVMKLALKYRPDVELVVATTHLLYNPKRSDIKLAQTQLMLAELERMAYKGRNEVTDQPEYLPIIFTGDMNYSPESAIYQLVTKRHLEYAGMSNKYLLPNADGYKLNILLPETVGVTDSCQYLANVLKRKGTWDVKFESGRLNHFLNLTSVYDHVRKDEPEATTNQEKWVTVDYIFYSEAETEIPKSGSGGNLKLISKLTLPTAVEAEHELMHIPNLACASDHLPLLATFHVTGS